MRRFVPLVLAVVVAAGCAQPAPDPAEVDPAAADVLAALDPSADPCDDFYRFACGGWLDATELPADESRYVRSFSTIRDLNEVRLRELVDAPGSAPEHQLVATYFASCVDEEAIEARGLEPLAPWLAEVDAVRDLGDTFRVAGRMQWLPGASPLLAFGVGRDFGDPTTNIFQIYQGGLGLPDRSYYLDPQRAAILAAYREHVAAMLTLAGLEPARAAADADRIVAFETELARVSKPREALRDIQSRYHKIDRPGLEALDPQLPWGAWFAALDAESVFDINVADPEFVRASGAILRATEVETLRAYLRWQLVEAMAGKLPRAFVDEAFAFRQKLTGQAELPERWKRCLHATTSSFPDIVGRLYVERHFPGASRDVAREMVHAVEGAFDARLDELAWMDAETRAAARAKAEALRNKIGYPDRWREKREVAVEPDRYFENAVASTAVDLRRDLAKVSQPVDPDEWRMPASTVNAYYSPTGNEIVFPAGILQPPFFDQGFPSAMNYGAMGAVVGHELTHGFDDQGRKFDGEGRLRDWWDAGTAERFEGRAQCLVDLYDGFAVDPETHVNGRLTLGENIADLGGLSLGHRAWRGAAGEAATAASPVPGLSQEQLLFVAYAQAWCTVATPEVERLLATIDSHSPPRFRVNGVVRNLPAFAEAFSCESGAPLRAEPVCEVW